jgi:hypothetical protein
MTDHGMTGFVTGGMYQVISHSWEMVSEQAASIAQTR